ncbi:hypothetical protein BH09CHL1_BH09CHL1_29670 [soil metagenome]
MFGTFVRLKGLWDHGDLVATVQKDLGAESLWLTWILPGNPIKYQEAKAQSGQVERCPGNPRNACWEPIED